MNQGTLLRVAASTELVDEALTEDSRIAPGPRFHAEVMREIRRAATPPLPFPWRRVAAGLALAGAAAGIALAAPEGTPFAPPSLAVLAPAAALLFAVPDLILGLRRRR